MAAYPLTDAYYLQQQQQQPPQPPPPPSAPATVAQAKPPGSTMATAAAASATATTSMYERQQHPPSLLQPQPMLLQSLVLTTTVDPSYGQQHQHHHQQQHHQQQQHPPGGRGGCPSSLRQGQVNILTSVGNVPVGPSHLLSHHNPPLHRPPPPQPDRRKQLPDAASFSSAAPPSGNDVQQARMPPSFVGRPLWSSKANCLPKAVEPLDIPTAAAAASLASAAAAAGSASAAAAAAFSRRPRKALAPPVAAPANNIPPCQVPAPPIRATTSMAGHGAGGTDDLNSYLHAKATSHRQYQGPTGVNSSSSVSLYTAAAKSTVVANGWSSSGSADRNVQAGDDQPLDLTSVRKKRQPEEAASDDSPLDLSIKKRRVDDALGAERLQRPPVADAAGHSGFPYNRRGGAVVTGPPLSVNHDVNARLAFQRPLVEALGQARIFSLPSGAVLIPPSLAGVATSSRGHRQTQNMPRSPKAFNASMRSASSSVAANSFPMFPRRTGTSEPTSSYAGIEVPVIRTAAAGFQFLPQTGAQSVVASGSITSDKSGSASFNRNSAMCEDLGNNFAMGQRTRSLLQQHQQQQQQQQPSLGTCSTTPRSNIPKMLIAEQKMSLKDFNELSRYSDLNRASAASAVAAQTALEVGSHLLTAPLIKTVQDQQQQQPGSFCGAKQPAAAVGVIACNDVNNRNKSNNLHDALASVFTDSIPKTASYGVRPNSRGSHAKSRTPRPSVNSQTTAHDTSSTTSTASSSSSSSFLNSSSMSMSSASIAEQRAPYLECLRLQDKDRLVSTPNRDSHLAGGAATAVATSKVELTWNKEHESLSTKSGMSFQGEEETKRQVIQSMQTESPKRLSSLHLSDAASQSASAASLNCSYLQPGVALMENNRVAGADPKILKDDLAVKDEVPKDAMRSVEVDLSADLSSAANWLDSGGNYKRSHSNVTDLYTNAKKAADPFGPSCAARGDRPDTTGGTRSVLQPDEQSDVVKQTETGLANYRDDPVLLTSCVPKQEPDAFSVKKSQQCTTLTMASADLPPVDPKEEVPDRGVSGPPEGGCGTCKLKECSDSVLPTKNSFPKILTPCRNCDPRETMCDGGHTQATPAAAFSAADLILRPCRGFDRQGTRRIPVANVQPFMKEPPDPAVSRSTVDPPVQPTLEDVQKSEDTEVDTTSDATDDADAKAAMTTCGVLKLDSQTVQGWTSGDTPHLKEFVKFLEFSAANPYRTPDEKLRETVGPDSAAGDSTECDDRGKVKRQLLMHLGAGPKGRSPKPTGDAKRDAAGLVAGGGGGCDWKKTPVEYIDEDNCVEPVRGKQKAATGGETRDPLGAKTTSTTAENDDSIYGASALYQTMKALDRQAEDRFKTSLLANRSAFSVSRATDLDRKAQMTSGEGGVFTYGLNRASDRPLSDLTLEQRLKKRQRQKLTSIDEAKMQQETQRSDDMASGIVDQRTKDALIELASSVASAADETTASEADDSYVASTSALGESASSSRPAMKRKYQRKKTKQEEPPMAGDGRRNELANELTGSRSSAATSTSSLESREVGTGPKKRRRRAIELLTQFNRQDDVPDVAEDRLSRSTTELNASVTHSSPAILLQVPQFLQQTTAESSTGRRRGTSARRDGSIVRHARRCSTYDRNAAYEAELKQEAERRLVRRGHGRGCRAAARHQARILGPHRRTDAEPRNDSPTASYAADDATGPYPHLQQQQQQLQRVDDETTRDLFEYDDSSDAVFPSRRGQGRKPVRKNGRIAFQYPEVFGRRRARGGLRGRSRPVRSSGGAGIIAGSWDSHDPSHDSKDFEVDRKCSEGVLIADLRDSFSLQSISQQIAPAASVAAAATTTSIRGKVRSRVRVGGRGSRGHPRTHSAAPRGYDAAAAPPPAPAATDSRPCASGLCRDTSETRLHQVTRLGYEELVSYYLTTGIIHPNVQDNSGVTPLHDSCSHGYLNITRLLLDHGAHPNSKALDGTRPLHLAVANDHVEIVRLLLSYGADVTMTNAAGRSPLQVAKTRNMKLLLKGFASDLSGGKGKEIAWQFPALFEIGACDVLADAPTDDLIEAAEVIFDLGTDNLLPVHRFVPDSQRGPRNFHSVCDLCEDVKVEDFLLLNSDLTFVHVANATDLPSTEAASSADNPGHLPPEQSSSSSSSHYHPLSHLSCGASASSVSITNQQQQQQQQLQQLQHRGWMPLSSSRQRTPCFSSAIGADRSSYAEIDASLKGLLDIGVHRVPLHTPPDVPSPSNDRFPSRRKGAANSRDSPAPVGGNASNGVSSGSLGGSNLSRVSPPSSSFALLTIHHTMRSELVIPGDVTTAPAPSGVEQPTSNCDTLSNDEDPMRVVDSKKKTPNRSASPDPPSSAPTPRATPLPLQADPRGECGSSRETLEQCRIVLCDIKGPPLTDLNSIRYDAAVTAARRGIEEAATAIHRGGGGVAGGGAGGEEREKEDWKNSDRKQTVHNNEHTGTRAALPVRMCTSVADKLTGHVGKTSKDLTLSMNSIPVAASQRPSLGSSLTNCSSSSAIAAGSRVPHQRPTVFSNARRRPTSRELVDRGVTSKPEGSQPESLIPVLEKHGSDDETPPVENEEDVCGESYDDEREMPQLTLYA